MTHLLLAYAVNGWCDQFGHEVTGIAPYKNVNKGCKKDKKNCLTFRGISWTGGRRGGYVPSTPQHSKLTLSDLEFEIPYTIPKSV